MLLLVPLALSPEPMAAVGTSEQRRTTGMMWHSNTSITAVAGTAHQKPNMAALALGVTLTAFATVTTARCATWKSV